jgi:xanthine dehydrogenase YagT iron-sulfur-binding subunit
MDLRSIRRLPVYAGDFRQRRRAATQGQRPFHAWLAKVDCGKSRKDASQMRIRRYLWRSAASEQPARASPFQEIGMPPFDTRPPGVPEAATRPSRPAPLGSDVSRRSFIQTLGLSAAGAAVGTRVQQAIAGANGVAQDSGMPEAAVLGPEPFEVTLRVNGNDLKASVDPATTLMETLRWHMNLTGTKEVCDRGACGGCSLLVDGQLIASCMMLTIDAVGCEVTTVEGLAKDGQLDPVQEAFCRHDALQCGYCTPGLIMASKALLNQHRRPTLDQIKHGLSGNICRCGTYTNVFNAVLEASGQNPVMDAGGRA